MNNDNLLELLLKLNQADLFEAFAKSNMDFFYLVNVYMNSDICASIDKEFSRYHNVSPFLIFELLHKEDKELSNHFRTEEVNIEAARWLGYFYRYWQLHTKEKSSKIIKQLSAKEGIRSYFVLHQSSEDVGIMKCKRLYNLRRNSHRSFESKQLVVNYSDISKESSFELAKASLVKLYKMPEYISLDENINSNTKYDLLSFDKNTGINIERLKRINNNCIKKYKESNKDMMFSNYTANNSICFFIVEDPSKIETVEKVMDNFCDEFLKTKSKYNTVYFLVNDVLFEINKQYRVTKYNIGSLKYTEKKLKPIS